MLFIFILQSFQTIFQSRYVSLFIPHLNLKLKVSQIFIVYISVAVETMNKIACSQLEKLEEKCPAITKPTDEVCLSVKLCFTDCVHKSFVPALP